MANGKWCQPDVPHRGWDCVGIEDLEEERATCEMCEVQEIRYVHEMIHPGYADTLHVGCICAGNMSGDYAAARRREQPLRSAARRQRERRRKWPSRWRISTKGNPWIRTDGFLITVFAEDGGWRFRLIDETAGADWKSRVYPTEEAAKLVAFDGMIWATKRRSKTRAPSVHQDTHAD